MFSWEIFKKSLFAEHLTVHYNFSQFYDMTELFGRLWVQNWHVSYFLYHCFDFLYGCFRTKVFSKCKFPTHYNIGSSTILIESLKVRSWITVSSPSNLLWKLWIWFFLDIMLCYYFSLEAVLQDIAENNPTKKQIDAEDPGTLCKACASGKICRRENVKFIVTNCKD